MLINLNQKELDVLLEIVRSSGYKDIEKKMKERIDAEQKMIGSHRLLDIIYHATRSLNLTKEDSLAAICHYLVREFVSLDVSLSDILNSVTIGYNAYCNQRSTPSN